jgi:hypothetical protein
MKKIINFKLFFLFALFILYCHSADAQSIQISTPNGGESWRLGSTQSITWTYLYLETSSTATLELLKDGVRIGEIASGVRIDSPSFSWRVGDYTGGVASSGTGYSIRITVSYYGRTITDTSNSPFQITSLDFSPAEVPGHLVQRFLRVTQPNGGERWPMGSTQTISWQFGSGMTGNVRILITRAGAAIYTIATDVPISARSYAWVIPGGGTGESTIRIELGDGSSEGARRIVIGEEGEGSGATSTTGLKIMIESLSMPGLTDESDGTFTVYAPGAITVTQPRHISVVDAGSPFIIRWDKSGDMGSRVRIDLYQEGRKIETIDGSTNNDGEYSWNVPLKYSGSLFKVVVETLDMVPVRGQSETFKIRGLKPKN